MTQILPHSTQFASKWQEWLDYRKELKKPYKTEKGITQALNMLGKLSEKGAIDTINNSMAQEYQGLFEPKKGKFDKEETPTQLSAPKVQKLSTYEAKPFDNENHKNMREKLRANFEHGTFIKDYGNIYTDILIRKCGLDIPKEVLYSIGKEELEEATRPRNRFEEQYSGDIESEIRDKILNYWLDQMREQGIDVSLKI